MERLNLGKVKNDIDVFWNLAVHDLSILFYLFEKSQFKKINKIVNPKKGRMVVFENVNKDNIIYKRSLHAGLPVIKGEKWAFNLWLREK